MNLNALLETFNLAFQASKNKARNALSIVLVLLVLQFFLAIYWSSPPAVFDVNNNTQQYAENNNQSIVTGYTTTTTLITVAETLLNKSGGYISNDIAPPSLFIDNIKNWEYGVLIQIRDLARVLRNDMSRSQSQSIENKDLSLTEPKFNFDNNSWALPATESEYQNAIDHLTLYLDDISQSSQPNAQFYSRADNLTDWLGVIEKRLGSLSQRLSASVGQERINTDLAGDSDAEQATQTPKEIKVKTPWLEIDDVFYQARGSTWALIHFLKAIEVDFNSVLKKKNAQISLKQIIRELEASQQELWSPIILNGSGFGLVANHSLVMASYLSRANAAVIDLRNLLKQG
jgi:hypothetical protein